MDTNKRDFRASRLFRLYSSFSPAGRAVIAFAIPFTVLDSVHYYTAGSALIFSFPIMMGIFAWCGGVAAKFASREGGSGKNLSLAGRSAGLRLWLTSTIINTVVALLLGFPSFGATVISGAVFLCLLAPFYAVSGAVAGWLGGWLYQQYLQRTDISK